MRHIGFNFDPMDNSLRDSALPQISNSLGVGFGVPIRQNMQISLFGSVLPLNYTRKLRGLYLEPASTLDV